MKFIYLGGRGGKAIPVNTDRQVRAKGAMRRTHTVMATVFETSLPLREAISPRGVRGRRTSRHITVPCRHHAIRGAR